MNILAKNRPFHFTRTYMFGTLALFVSVSLLLASTANADKPGFQTQSKSPSFSKYTNGSVPFKKTGVGHPSPYSYKAKQYNTTMVQGKGNGNRGHGHAHGHYKHRTPTFYSYKTQPTFGTNRLYGNRRSVYYPSARSHFGLSLGYGINPLGTSTYYRPTYSTFPSTFGVYSSGTIGYSNPYGAYPSAYPSSPPPTLTAPEQAASNDLMNGTSTDQPNVIQNRFTPKIAADKAAEPTQLLAEQAFFQGNHEEAAALADQAIRLDKGNGMLRLFASHAHFANGNFSEAYMLLDEATVMLPSDKWGAVVKNFRTFYGRNDYVSQTDQLSQHLRDNPTDINSFVLRGFHFGCLEYAEAATKDFDKALQVDPAHPLANRLQTVIGVQPEPLPPEQIEAPSPANQGTGIIRLVPQFTQEELDNAVPVEPELNSGQTNSIIK